MLGLKPKFPFYSGLRTVSANLNGTYEVEKGRSELGFQMKRFTVLVMHLDDVGYMAVQWKR
jgi:hypothetical protein